MVLDVSVIPNQVVIASMFFVVYICAQFVYIIMQWMKLSFWSVRWDDCGCCCDLPACSEEQQEVDTRTAVPAMEAPPTKTPATLTCA